MFNNLIFTSNKDIKTSVAKHKFNMDEFNAILGPIFIGNKDAAKQYSQYFSTIVNCTPSLPFAEHVRTHKIRIPIDDDPRLANQMYDIIQKTQVLDTIHHCYKNNKKVLVHCHAGMQRSCCIVACYLIKYHDFTPQQAIAFIRTRRAIAFLPEANFNETLIMVYNDARIGKHLSV